jgi:hypothetical protein
MKHDDIVHLAESNGFFDGVESQEMRDLLVEFGKVACFAERAYWIRAMSNAFWRGAEADAPIETGDHNGF